MKPSIMISTKDIPVIVTEAETQLMQSHIGVYQRGSKLVKIGEYPRPEEDGYDIRFVDIVKENLIEYFTEIITWLKPDGFGKEPKPVGCPGWVAATYMARGGEWRLPTIRGIISAPTLRRDFSLLDKPGFDATTGLYYDPKGVIFPHVPDAPTKEQARKALDYIISMVSEVPFVVGEDNNNLNRSVFLSAVLSSLIRPILPTVPITGFNAPTAGSGKSILVDGISILLTGNPTKVVTQGDNEETTKRVSAVLQDGMPIVAIDNCTQPLGGDLLCQAVTASEIALRILGKTEIKIVANTAMYFATGNNLTYYGDLAARRALRCTIDAACEYPDAREFTTLRPDKAFKKYRAELVTAGLTVLRAFINAGMPQTAKGCDFEEWSRMVRNCLIWLGEPDPWLSSEEVRKEDPIRNNNGVALAVWYDTFEGKLVTTKEVLDKAKAFTTVQSWSSPESQHASSGSYRSKLENPELHDALQAVTDNQLTSQGVGCWLRSIKGSPISGYTVEQGKASNKGNRWKVTQQQATTPTNTDNDTTGDLDNFFFKK